MAPIKNPNLTWGERRGHTIHRCRFCGILLLTGEYAGFCCGKSGQYLDRIPRLPPLPPLYNTFIDHPQISSASRVLNLIFSFAALETTHQFPHPNGPPGFFTIEGRVYHRVRPNHPNSAVRWLLYDGFMKHSTPYAAWAAAIPPVWLDAVASSLVTYNPFVQSLIHLSMIDPISCPTAQLTLKDNSNASEIAAVMNFSNTTRTDTNCRSVIVVRHDRENQAVSTISRLWEPLAYPLLFPHATLGWGVIGSSTEFEHDTHHAHNSDADIDTATTQIMHYRARLL
jgi:hypothetical protein